jgi:hypothetical protein
MTPAEIVTELADLASQIRVLAHEAEALPNTEVSDWLRELADEVDQASAVVEPANPVRTETATWSQD